jgi:hypothetical protein
VGCVLLFLLFFLYVRLAHETRRAGKAGSWSPIFGRRFRGRSLIAGQVERREAQRPFSGLRKPVGRLAPRLASGRRNPVRQARSRSLVSSGKGSRKPLAPPGAPFSFRTETGNGRPRARSISRGSGALATFTPHRRVLICVTVFPGRSAARSGAKWCAADPGSLRTQSL